MAALVPKPMIPPWLMPEQMVVESFPRNTILANIQFSG